MVYKIFLMRKFRTAVLRLGIAFISITFIIILLSKSRPSPDDSNVLVIDSKQLDAKLRRFNELNPVIDGWGEKGQGVDLNDPEKNAIAKGLFKMGSFNVYVSDRISPNRTLHDPRPYECSPIKYNIDELGTASVVIIYTNEIWSALIRTIWSVINRTPPKLLKEIILVDDFSDKKELVADLKDYIRHYFPKIVRIIRLSKREGLIRARIIGAKATSGDVIVFLDSHCEATKEWLQPLLKKIKESKNNVVCPVIDVISDKNLEYNVGDPYYFQLGGFTWSGQFTWIDMEENYVRKHPAEAIASPTMAGGLFAIDREYFFHIGSYDEKMEIWGGENLELSFRIWQCGGNLLIHPCSHVGHIFRDSHPYSFKGIDSHGMNTLRTFRVWMDPKYYKYFYMHREDMRTKDPGDLSDRFALKRHLKCKSFDWYLKTIYGGKKWMHDVNSIGYGAVRNPITDMCLDVMNQEEDDKGYQVGLFNCNPHGEGLEFWNNQAFALMNNGELRREEVCLEISQTEDKVVTEKCLIVELQHNKRYAKQEKQKQIWIHKRGGQIQNSMTGECLTTSGVKSGGWLKAGPCDKNDLYQIWWFQIYSNSTIY